jgi:hypothetical protein
MVGMLLGILTYRPIFNIFLTESSINKQFVKEYIVNENVFTKKVELAQNKKDSLAIYSKTYPFPAEINLSHSFTLTYTDTIFQDKSKPVSKSKEKYINIKLKSPTYWKFIGLVFLLILYVTMVYGPIAAFLVEMFPTKIRYTSMSLPYHIGNGVFGGLVPFIGLLLTTTYPKDPLVGLWYPISVATLCFIIGVVYLRNKIDKEVND